MRAILVRPLGLSAFVRCANEEEFVVASLLSAYRVFDEIVVILNNSTDRTQILVEGLLTDYPKIRILNYPNKCSVVGPGYMDRVTRDPSSSLAAYYNWCIDQTTYSHVCKWDGDMVAIPTFEDVHKYISDYDVVIFDGYDVLGQDTTSKEARIFKYDRDRARYLDWDLYEVLDHDYSKMFVVQNECYLHMKLVKNEWLHKQWSNPNLLAERSAPETGAPPSKRRSSVRDLLSKIRRSMGRRPKIEPFD